MGGILSSHLTVRYAMGALGIFAGWLFVAGSKWAGFSHVLHPVAFAGMHGTEDAFRFNVMVFVLPGALLSLAALGLRTWLPEDARWPPRIGATLLLISAVAFAAQGLLPLDPDNLDAGASRWHASAWMVWCIAFAAGALLYGRATRVEQFVALAAVLLVLGMSMLGRDWIPAGFAQRIAFVTWFGWYWYAAARAVSRGAVSATG